ncbi:MAG: transglutaminase domain-containing protein [Lachnospiraceae bacterium]|nr:transglutaminase domain-containing protein [Lachnospiraceae bacterium]
MRTLKIKTKRTLSFLLMIMLAMSMTLGACGKSSKENKSKYEEDDDDDEDEDDKSSKKKKKDKDSDDESSRSDAIYYAAELIMGDTSYNCLEMGMTPENTNVVMHGNKSCTLTMGGFPTEFDIKDGKMYASGQALYEFDRVSRDEIKIDMQGTVYLFYLKDSELAEAAGLHEGASGPSPSEKKRKYRDLIAGEQEYEVDGGVLYYETDPEGVLISYGDVIADELHIPEEIDGEPVFAIRRIHGDFKKLYLPSTLKTIYASFGDFEGVEEIYVGDGDECALCYMSQGCCNYGHFIKDDLKEIHFAPSMADNENIKLKAGFLGGAFELEEVENMPPLWEEGYLSLEKAEAMLLKNDPKKYVTPQSKKVTNLAKEVTEGAVTDEEKVFLISEWIVDNVCYDTVGYREYCYEQFAKADGKTYEPKARTEWVEPEDVIEHKKTVCDGYARLTKAMCNAVGIPAVYVSGTIPSLDSLVNKHGWNMVYIDGVWKHIDNTWCDKDYNTQIIVDEEEEEVVDVETSDEGAITYEYYMSNEELQEDYTWEEIEQINNANLEKYSFKNCHDFFCLPALAMGFDHIAEEVDGTPVK